MVAFEAFPYRENPVKTAQVIDARQALRAGTRAGHDRVDTHFADGLRSNADYATYLRGMHALVSGVDAAIARGLLSPAWRGWSLTARVGWLRADLDALALLPVQAPPMGALGDGAARAVTHGDVGRDDAAAAGVMYVVEGSALGARGLLGDARRLGHDADRGAGFLARHADGEGGRRWPRFVAALAGDAFGTAAGRDGMLHAASAAFAHADLCFRLAAAAAPRVHHPATPGPAPTDHARSP